MLALALLFMLAANLRLCYRVYVDGERCEGLYSRRAVSRGTEAARAAAEELLPGEAILPEIRKRPSLTLREPESSGAELCGAILSRTEGVARLYSVSAGGVCFGTVAEPEKLEEKLRASLYSRMPPTSGHARFAEPIELRPVFSRVGTDTPFREMAQLVSGAVPAIITDGEGHIIQG